MQQIIAATFLFRKHYEKNNPRYFNDITRKMFIVDRIMVGLF